MRPVGDVLSHLFGNWRSTRKILTSSRTRFLARGVEAGLLPERRTCSCYGRRCRGFASAELLLMAPLTEDAIRP